MVIAVTIPLVNPNEPEANLVAIHVSEGQAISTGDSICTLETTKATSELTAEADGYIVGLRLSAGQFVQAGEVLCYLSDSLEWKPEVSDPLSQAEEMTIDSTLPKGLRITQPALALARELGLNLDSFPLGELVTIATVRSLQGKIPSGKTPASEREFDPMAILIFGGGGHGKSLIEFIRALGVYRIAGVLDDSRPVGESILGIPVLGGSNILAKLYAQGIRLAVNAVGGIGNIVLRINIFKNMADAGFVFPALAHPAAFIEPSASLAPGVQVFPQAYVGSDARIGYGVIVNTGAIVSHDCVLGNYTNVSPGAILAGGVQVGEAVLIGMGVTINLGVQIGEGARIGNGATIKSNLPARKVVRAGMIWPE